MADFLIIYNYSIRLVAAHTAETYPPVVVWHRARVHLHNPSGAVLCVRRTTHTRIRFTASSGAHVYVCACVRVCVSLWSYGTYKPAIPYQTPLIFEKRSLNKAIRARAHTVLLCVETMCVCLQIAHTRYARNAYCMCVGVSSLIKLICQSNYSTLFSLSLVAVARGSLENTRKRCARLSQRDHQPGWAAFWVLKFPMAFYGDAKECPFRVRRKWQSESVHITKYTHTPHSVYTNTRINIWACVCILFAHPHKTLNRSCACECAIIITGHFTA